MQIYALKRQILVLVCCVPMLISVPAHGAQEDVVNPTQFDQLMKQVSDTLISLRWIDKVKDKVRETHGAADDVYEVLVANGRKEEAEQFLRVKKKLVTTLKQMPQRRQHFFNTVQEMLNYRNQQLPQAMRDLKASAEVISKFQKELKDELEEYEKRKKGEQGQAGPVGAGTEGGSPGGGREWDESGYEFYYLGASGDVKFSFGLDSDLEVGDRKPVTWDAEKKAYAIQVVARMNWGEKRKKEMLARQPDSIASYTGDRTHFGYKVNLPGGGTGETQWAVTEEKYSWFPVASRTDADWVVKESGLTGVEQDMIILYATRPTRFTLDVTGEVKWKTTYKTHGKPIEQEDEATGKVEFTISPK